MRVMHVMRTVVSSHIRFVFGFHGVIESGDLHSQWRRDIRLNRQGHTHTHLYTLDNIKKTGIITHTFYSRIQKGEAPTQLHTPMYAPTPTHILGVSTSSVFQLCLLHASSWQHHRAPVLLS